MGPVVEVSDMPVVPLTSVVSVVVPGLDSAFPEVSEAFVVEDDGSWVSLGPVAPWLVPVSFCASS